MKKKFFGALVVVVIAVGAMINVNLNKVSNKGDLAMANVEALAFEFDGTQWNTTDTHLIGSHWCPELRSCTVTYGVDAGVVYTTTYTGQGVACVNGNGNCFNGTGCI